MPNPRLVVTPRPVVTPHLVVTPHFVVMRRLVAMCIMAAFVLAPLATGHAQQAPAAGSDYFIPPQARPAAPARPAVRPATGAAPASSVIDSSVLTIRLGEGFDTSGLVWPRLALITVNIH